MPEEERTGVRLTNLDQPLYADAGATKRDLVDYLDAVADRFVPVLAGRALSVVRILRGQAPFMQKNLPAYAPASIPHPGRPDAGRETGRSLSRLRRPGDPPVVREPARGRVPPDPVPRACVRLPHPPGGRHRPAGGHRRLRARGGGRTPRATGARRRRYDGTGQEQWGEGRACRRPTGAGASGADVAAATRAVAARAERLDPKLTTTAFVVEDRGGKVFLDATRAGGATVVAAYSPRVRPGVPVSFPLAWDDLADASPAEFTITTVPRLLGDADPWTTLMPPPQTLDRGLVEEGHTIPIARVAAMHAGKRRARARRAAEPDR